MSEFTPTTEHVRDIYAAGPWSRVADRNAAFDRWLTAHDAAIRDAALEEGAVIAETRDKGYAQHPDDGIVKRSQESIAYMIRAAKEGEGK